MATAQITNERGNTIIIEVERGPSPDEMTYAIKGPTSETTHTITRLEYEALRLACNRTLLE